MPTSRDLVSSDVKRCAEKYYTFGITVFDDAVLGWTESKLIERKLREADRSKFYHRDSVGSQGEHAKFTLLDTDLTLSMFPFLRETYENVRRVTEAIVGEKVILSPHRRSAVNLRIYEEGENEGLHYDTNPLSALLFVTEGGAPLQVETLQGWVDIVPQRGKAVVFQGRKCKHRVPVGEPGAFRVTAPMNLYFPYDQERPAYIDKLCYDGMSYEDAARQTVS